MNWKPTDVEFLEDSKRCDAAFVKYMHRADFDDDNHSVLFICHGNVIRYMVTSFIVTNATYLPL